MATIADDRLERLAALVGARKVTPAAIRVVRTCPAPARQLLGNLRQVDALLAVLDGFSGTGDPASDLETLELELLVADTRPRRSGGSSASRSRRSRAMPRVRKEAELAAAGARAPRGGRAADRVAGRAPAGARPADDEAAARDRERPERDRLQARGRAGGARRRGGRRVPRRPRSALDEVVRRLKDALGLITFFTAGDKETRAWTLRDGQTALEAGGTIHTDIARGFIRCEVIRWRRPARRAAPTPRRPSGARSGSRARPTSSQDGDVLNIRFNV